MIKVLFMGRKPIATSALEFLLCLEDVDVVGVLTDSHLDVSSTARLAENKRIPLYTYEQAIELLDVGELHFDLGVSVLYWRKLKGKFLTVPDLGIINFHPAPLPEYKGTAGYNMAIMDELDEWAATAHYVDEDIDTGRIIDIFRFSIFHKLETAKSLEEKTMPFILELFKKTLLRALSFDKKLEASPNEGGRYISRQQMEEMKEIVDGDDISKKIRAFWFPPYDGAYITINGQKYTLLDRAMLENLAGPGVSSLFSKKAP